MVNQHHGNWNTSSSGGSYGGGEDFGSPFGGGSYSPPSTASEANVPYDPGPGPRGGDTPVETGIIDKNVFTAGSSDDPYNEKGDYMDWDAINQQTGLTAGQALAHRTDAALKKQKERQIAMENSMALAYNTQQQGDAWIEEGGKWVKNPNVTSKQVSNLHNLTDAEMQQLIDSGFVAAEASGVLGGVSGIETTVNKLKKQVLQGSGKEKKDAFDALAKLVKGDPTNIIYGMSGTKAYDNFFINDKGQKVYTTAGGYDAGYDPSGVHSWDEVENTPYLYEAYNKLMSGDITPQEARDYMTNIQAFGHGGKKTGSGDGSGGYGYGYGYGGGGGGGGGGYGYGGDEDPMARGYQRGKVGPGGLLEAVNQLYLRLSGMNKKRGGIVSLLELA
jgi:hypothetical protein